MSAVNEPQRVSKLQGGQTPGASSNVAPPGTAPVTDGKGAASQSKPAARNNGLALSGKPGHSQLALPATPGTHNKSAEQVPDYKDAFGDASYVKDGTNKDMVAFAQKVVDKSPALKDSALAQHLKEGKLDPESVKALQSELLAKGYDVGHTGTDGKYGPNTHAALQKMLAGEKAGGSIKTESKPAAEPPKAEKPTEKPTASDGHTAIYDVSSHTVTLPNGTKLEAHSGRGSAQDNPTSQNQRNRGTTPTGTYKLTPREARYHGVAALRLTPTNGTNTHGRDGLLAHTYMLGSRGESHGCVVFKNYPAFLQAYNSGQINQIKIVP